MTQRKKKGKNCLRGQFPALHEGEKRGGEKEKKRKGPWHDSAYVPVLGQRYWRNKKKKKGVAGPIQEVKAET